MIGRDGDLPWRLPDDLRRFKALTTGHAVVMGRKTYESIGRPLPDRLNIVLTSRAGWQADGVHVAGDLKQAISLAKQHQEIFVIGGQQVYTDAMAIADRVYLTRVQTTCKGDAHLIGFDPADWERVENEPHAADQDHAFAFEFHVYCRDNTRT